MTDDFVKEEPRTNSPVTDWPFANFTDVSLTCEGTNSLAHKVALGQKSALSIKFQTLFSLFIRTFLDFGTYVFLGKCRRALWA